MATRVLVVDDSGFFRRRVKEMLEEDPLLTVVGDAANGQEAIDKALELKPDVITMDIEMPVMDGIQATRKIMATNPVPIIMFSSLTTDGAKATLDALEAGALDFLPKRFEDISLDREEAKKLLCQRVRTIALKKHTLRKISPQAKTGSVEVRTNIPTAKPAARRIGTSVSKSGGIDLVAIGTSTGGPLALQNVLVGLPENFPKPIVMIQHMPATFTPAFAKRLDQLCKISVKEAEDGDHLKPGYAYLAPGGKQMLIDGRAGNAVIRIIDGEPTLTYKPSVDITFRSIDKVFSGKTLAIVLTGMGADGREGARVLKTHGSEIWAQDEESCVVYGMPAAIVDAGLADNVMGINEFTQAIIKRV
ncbi:MAG: chemotaxis response regulator protein-glutamate methylesterase [Gammaproteobacteria bacterium]|nr:chemotaxis response regulator protein-glutamate methylesterase [Gammaproteobacteria bacterium]